MAYISKVRWLSCLFVISSSLVVIISYSCCCCSEGILAGYFLHPQMGRYTINGFIMMKSVCIDDPFGVLKSLIDFHFFCNFTDFCHWYIEKLWVFEVLLNFQEEGFSIFDWTINLVVYYIIDSNCILLCYCWLC